MSKINPDETVETEETQEVKITKVNNQHKTLTMLNPFILIKHINKTLIC